MDQKIKKLSRSGEWIESQLVSYSFDENIFYKKETFFVPFGLPLPPSTPSPLTPFSNSANSNSKTPLSYPININMDV